MGNNEKVKASKSEESCSPAPPDQTNNPMYADWAAMQAYYGPRMAIPPYYNSAMVPGHAPHPYMWGPPQHMMPPYGGAYAAIYSHGGVYAHPGAPLGSPAPGLGVSSSPAVPEVLAPTPLCTEGSKLSGNTEQGLMKKLKSFDGLAMSIGNGSENVEGGADHMVSQSSEMEGSTDGSDGNTGLGQTAKTKRKRIREGALTLGLDGKPEAQASAAPATDTDSDTKVKVMSAGPGKLVASVLSPSMNTTLELKNSPSINSKLGTHVSPAGAIVPSENWMQKERELKRERRKQSNRESARRSRLRRQAETEELATKVESLSAENMSFKSEINRLLEKSAKLKLENATLREKLRNSGSGHTEEMILDKVDDKWSQPVSTENLLSRVNDTGSVNRSHEEEGEVYGNKKPSTKLHQLLDRNPMADAVAAS